MLNTIPPDNRGRPTGPGLDRPHARVNHEGGWVTGRLLRSAALSPLLSLYQQYRYTGSITLIAGPTFLPTTGAC